MRRQHLAAGVNPLNGLPWPEGEPRSGASIVEPVLDSLRADNRPCARRVLSSAVGRVAVAVSRLSNGMAHCLRVDTRS